MSPADEIRNSSGMQPLSRKRVNAFWSAGRDYSPLEGEGIPRLRISRTSPPPLSGSAMALGHPKAGEPPPPEVPS